MAFIDLAHTGAVPPGCALPPCPVIGIGSRDHPIAAWLDAVLEPGFSAETIARNVLNHPHAAAVTVQLLRLLPGLSSEHGLVAESMAYGLLQGSAEHRSWIAAQKAQVHPAGTVELERSDNTLSIELNRPDCGNSIDRTMRDALYEAFTLAAIDPAIERIVLRAVGRTFSLGADLAEFGTINDPATAHAIRQKTLPARSAHLCADRLEAWVQGGCVGAGLELAAWARRITAKADAWFQLPELAMGILPGAGGCVSLTRRIGRQRTALLILSGKRLNARQALDWGLIDAIVDDMSADQRSADISG